MNKLLEIEAIKQLKYRYFRLLDQKQWQEMEALFVPECSVDYHDGRYAYPNREALMAFLQEALSSCDMVTLHQGHHPEIELVSDTEATGKWYLHDIVYNFEHKVKREGNGFYQDRYVKVDGEWRFAHTGYKRTFEILQPMGETLEIYNGFEAGAF